MSPPSGTVADWLPPKVRLVGELAATAPPDETAMVAWPICSGPLPSPDRKPGSDNRIRTVPPPVEASVSIRRVWSPQLPVGPLKPSSTGEAQAPVHDSAAVRPASVPPASGVAVVVLRTAMPKMCSAGGWLLAGELPESSCTFTESPTSGSVTEAIWQAGSTGAANAYTFGPDATWPLEVSLSGTVSAAMSPGPCTQSGTVR